MSSEIFKVIEQEYNISADDSAAFVWLLFFAVPTWLHALAKGKPPKWFWTITTIGLGLESYLHYEGAFDRTSIMLAVDGAGSAVAATRGWSSRKRD